MTDKILEYQRCLKEFNEHTNIYSKSAYDKLGFHIQDSLVLADLLAALSGVCVDFGSGSGLPAVPIAIKNPNKKVICIESKSKKRAFLEDVKCELSLDNLFVFNGDIDLFISKNKMSIRVVTAKAFADKCKVIKLARRLKRKELDVFIPVSKSQILNYDDRDKAAVITYDQGNNSFYYFNKKL